MLQKQNPFVLIVPNPNSLQFCIRNPRIQPEKLPPLPNLLLLTMSTMNQPATPPPTIGKMGPYTVFVTPSDSSHFSVSDSGKKHYIPPTSVQLTPVKSAPLVQPPPVQYGKSTPSKLALFWDAVAKVQNGTFFFFIFPFHF